MPKDEREAARLFRKAAAQGNPVAQSNLGAFYQNGKGVPKDELEAARLFRCAAEQGNSSGQSNLGLCCEYGKGVPKDEQEAVRWYKLAADQGHARAMNNLGVCYQIGKGVEKNEKMAAKWYFLAADQGHPLAQSNLENVWASMGFSGSETDSKPSDAGAAANGTADSPNVPTAAPPASGGEIGGGGLADRLKKAKEQKTGV